MSVSCQLLQLLGGVGFAPARWADGGSRQESWGVWDHIKGRRGRWLREWTRGNHPCNPFCCGHKQHCSAVLGSACS
jgi:hypothetical protein